MDDLHTRIFLEVWPCSYIPNRTRRRLEFCGTNPDGMTRIADGRVLKPIE